MIKKFAIAAFVLVALIFLVVNSSIVESNFRCNGSWTGTAPGGNLPRTIYMKLTEYRWWSVAARTGQSDGSATMEIPNEWVEYYGHVEKGGDQFRIYETYPAKSLRGNFSMLSNTLAIDMEPPFGFFDGTCSRLP